MDLTGVLTQALLGDSTVQKVGSKSEASGEQVQQLIAAALPILISGMNQNAKTQEGAQSLDTALETHGSEDTSDIGKMIEAIDPAEGAKILDHVLGDKKSDIQNGLAKKTGLSTTQVTSVLSVVAPLLLSLLGGHKKEQNVDSNGLSGMLSSLLGGSAASNSSEGFGLDDIASLLLGGSSQGGSGQSSTGGGLLGSLLGGGGSGDGNNTTGGELVSLAGSLLGSLISTKTDKPSSGKKKKKKESDTGELLGQLLGSLLK
ncbi:MAG: DUF937 domain-containing protein [Oscillospiraceae bacterium]